MRRKRFDMTVELFIEMGPDRFHSASVGPLTPAEMLELLRHKTPREADMLAIADGNERLRDLLTEAVCQWNGTFNDDDIMGHHGTGDMRWLGVAVKSQCDEMHVYAQRLEGEEGICTVYVDQDAIADDTRKCALAALEALMPIQKPGGNRK
jgi:hypothetical protein